MGVVVVVETAWADYSLSLSLCLSYQSQLELDNIDIRHQ
jgi:hypothetical protein